MDELDAIAEARREKTQGLREARLAKEVEDRAKAAAAGALPKGGKKA